MVKSCKVVKTGTHGESCICKESLQVLAGASDRCRQNQHQDIANTCRTVYHSKNLKRGMASRAVNFTHVIDWHIMGDRLVHWSKPGGGICVRTLRGPNGQACQFSDSTTFKLEEEIAGREIRTVFAQSLKDGDLLVTACSKPSSASSPDALHTDAVLMKVSLREENMKIYLNNDVGEHWYLIEEDNLAFRIEFPGQITCRPALGQDCAYFVQNRSTSTGKSQPRFTKVSLADGAILFSKIVPEIKEAGTIYDDGQSTIPETSDDAKASTPGRPIDVPRLDRQMVLTKSEDLAIWSDSGLRMYIFCTHTGTLLYTHDRHPNSSISMMPGHDSFWYSYYEDTPAGRCFTHRYCCFSKAHRRVLFGLPYYQNSLTSAIMDDACLDVRVEHERYNLLQATIRGSNVTVDPFTAFRIGTMDWRKHFQEAVPQWVDRMVIPYLGHNHSNDQEYVVLEPRDIPYKLVTLGRGSRVLEAEIPLAGQETEKCEMVDGYLVYSNPTTDQFLLIDFFPEW